MSLNPFISIVETEDSINKVEFSEALEDFVYEWWRLFSSQEFVIDTIIFEQNGDWDYQRAYIYIKEFYKYAIVDPERIKYSKEPNIGMIRILFDESGKLVSLYSSLLPRLKVPVNRAISQDSARTILNGYVYYWYYGHSNNGSHTIIKSDIKSLVLKTYLDWGGNEDYLVYRLCWEITTYNIIIPDPYYSPTGYRPVKIYIDALTGKIILAWDYA